MTSQTLDQFTIATAAPNLVALGFLRDETLASPNSRSFRLFLVLEAILTGTTVASMALSAPTSLTPSVGDRYIVGSSATGAWLSQENSIAIYVSASDGWSFIAPVEGWRIFDQNTNKTYVFDGTSWAVPAASTISADTDSLTLTGTDLQAVVESIDSLKAPKASPVFTGIPQVPSYTVATLPTATTTGIIYVSDETGGAVLAFSDGANWLRCTDRAIVS